MLMIKKFHKDAQKITKMHRENIKIQENFEVFNSLCESL